LSATLVLEVDWDGDDDFNDTGEDVSGNVFSIQTRRGRDYASMIVGRATGGKLRANLFNFDGDYSPFNTSSPLFGNLLPGRKVRLRSTSPVTKVLWTGKVDRIIPNIALKGLPLATLEASGIFINLNVPLSSSVYSGGSTGGSLDSILDDIDWPAGARSIDNGNTEIGPTYFDNIQALEALRQVWEDCEFGNLIEGLDWDIVAQSRYYRDITTKSLTSQATFSDDGVSALGYQSIAESDHLREVFNEVVADVQPFLPSDEAVLWSLGSEIITLAAGASRTYFAKATTVNNLNVLYVDPWTTPVVGTDFIQTGVADGDIDIDTIEFATAMKIVITNNGGATSTFSLAQVRGIPILAGTPFSVSAEDATSITAYGRRQFPAKSKWFDNSSYAQGAVDYILSRQKDPNPVESIIVQGKNDAHLTQMFTLDISDRITLEAENMTMLGINQDFYIEAITHTIVRSKFITTQYELSTAFDNHYFILNSSLLGGTDVLAP